MIKKYTLYRVFFYLTPSLSLRERAHVQCYHYDYRFKRCLMGSGFMPGWVIKVGYLFSTKRLLQESGKIGSFPARRLATSLNLFTVEIFNARPSCTGYILGESQKVVHILGWIGGELPGLGDGGGIAVMVYGMNVLPCFTGWH